MPPIPEIGKFFISLSPAIFATILRAIGFTAGPHIPPWLPLPSILGSGEKLSKLTDIIELTVLINETASAPPFKAALAGYLISVIFGVNLTITGIRVCDLHQRVTISIYSGTCPTAEPIPLSDIP